MAGRHTTEGRIYFLGKMFSRNYWFLLMFLSHEWVSMRMTPVHDLVFTSASHLIILFVHKQVIHWFPFGYFAELNALYSEKKSVAEDFHRAYALYRQYRREQRKERRQKQQAQIQARHQERYTTCALYKSFCISGSFFLPKALFMIWFHF